MSSILLHCVLNVIFTAEYGLDDDIVASGPEEVHVYANLLKMSAEGSKRPLVAKVILLTVLILDEFLIFLVDTVLSQMHVFISFVDL